MHFSLDTVSYRYYPAALFCLQDISVTIDSAKITGIAGANGSGKTTLIKILLRQLVDYTGTYRIDGQVSTDIGANLCSTYRIGYAPDIPILDETLTGYEILTIVAQIRGLPASQWDEEISLLSSYLHCGSWLKDQRCAEYSHGMRKKVSIACAYLGPVRFAVLDEPLNGLDPVAVRGTRDLMLNKKSTGTGTLVSSHILDFIEQCAEDCMLMKQGRMIYSGTLASLKKTNSDQRLDDIYLSLFNCD